MSMVVILFLLLSSSFDILANTVTVSYGYGIDETKKIIVVNQDIALLNSQTDGLISSIQIKDKHFDFNEQVGKLKIGQAYSVKNEKKNGFTLYFTQLPLIHITTTTTINKEEKTLAYFELTQSNAGTVSSLIGIKIRGGVSTWAFPKKNYRIEFWKDENGDETKDVSLLGMRWDDDWNLQGMYNEPLRATNIVGFELWRKINTLYYQSSERDAINGSRWKYSEMFLDGKYQGVYGVVEPIDRKQLKLKKYSEDKGIQGELYKGLCTCSYDPWRGTPEYGNPIWEEVFEYDYPNEIPADWDNLVSFKNFISFSSDKDFFEQYKLYFNIESAVDYFIFMNLLSGNDNKGKNLYLAKYKADDPYFFVAWDLDAVFGLGWDGKPENRTDEMLTNYFYDRLLKDFSEDGFRMKVKQKWDELRNSWLTVENIVEMFYKNYDFLLENGVYVREEKTWSSYRSKPQENFDYINDWLTKRIKYLDAEFKGLDVGIENIQMDLNEPCDIRIYNINGQLIKTLNNVLYNEKSISLSLNKGIYILNLDFAAGYRKNTVIVNQH